VKAFPKGLYERKTAEKQHRGYQVKLDAGLLLQSIGLSEESTHQKE